MSIGLCGAVVVRGGAGMIKLAVCQCVYIHYEAAQESVRTRRVKSFLF